ncbi:hypothetical protein AMURIS_01585 [Acetatifactor muris]|uniref:Uncharacterized protein n=1 Tax=Acetatifactor muris TaxID=879566 RepID=A0A2K4ZEI1_9FIRM|nr:hypothetical protein AMURIS_01585 [Acetatifactor muris]
MMLRAEEDTEKKMISRKGEYIWREENYRK